MASASQCVATTRALRVFHAWRRAVAKATRACRSGAGVGLSTDAGSSLSLPAAWVRSHVMSA